MPTHTAPTRMAPWKAMTISASLGSAHATRSPDRTPSASQAWAARSAMRSSSAYDHRWVRVTSAGRSSPLASARSNTLATEAGTTGGRGASGIAADHTPLPMARSNVPGQQRDRRPMDFDLGDRATDLRTRLRQLIAANVPEGYLGAFSDDPADLEVAQRFCRTLAAEGLLTVAWPEEYGGRGGSLWEQTVVREEMWAHHEPRGAQYMG